MFICRHWRNCLSLLVLFVLSLAVFLVEGCASHPQPGTVRVTADSSTVAAGTTTQLHAISTVSNKGTDATYVATWASSNTSVATVSDTGMLTGVVAGSVTITATVNGVSGSMLVTIGGPDVTGLVLTPQGAVVLNGGLQQYVATAAYSNGTTGDASTTATWSVLPTSVATISAAGVLTGVSPGAFTVTAIIGTHLAVAAGTVTNSEVSSIAITPSTVSIAGGKTQQFKATGTLTDGTTSDLTSTVTWSSSNTAVLTINTSGLGTAIAPAATTAVTVTATLGAISATATVSVTVPASLTALQVSPTSSSIAAGSAEQHSAIALYSDGTQEDVTASVTWTVSGVTNDVTNVKGGLRGRVAGAKAHADNSDSVASVNSNGEDQALTPGTTQVQATLGSTTTQSTVIVTSATVTSIAIRSSKSLFPVNSSQQLQLIGTFSDGTTQDLTLSGNWQSSNTAVATVDSGSGLAMGVKSGNVQFTASFGGLSTSTVGFQVLPLTLISTIINIPYSVEAIGASEQLTLLGTYDDGSIHDLTQLTTWTVSDPTVFRVNSSGLGYALSPGTTQITGTVNGISTISTVVSVDLPLISLQVLSPSPNFALGTTMDFTALSLFAGGFEIDTTSQVVWTSSDPTVLTIDGNGRAKGGKVGSTTVSASLLGITQFSTTISVTNATLVLLKIAPVSTQIAAFTNQQYMANGIYSDGSWQDVTPDVVWSTTDNTIASVDGDGLATGAKAGTVQVSATLSGLTATSSLVVTNASLVSVAVMPANLELPVGIVRQYSLTGTFSDGTTQDLTQQAIWSQPTPSYLSVLLKGEGIGAGAGTGTIEAQYGFFAASTQAYVTNATLTGLAITPASTSIRQTQQQQMTSTATFSDGYVMDITELNTVFSSSSPLVASIAEAAIAFAANVGTTTITATYDGLTSSTVKFQVQSDVVTAFSISPAAPVLSGGTTLQLVANATFADSSTGDAAQLATWTSSNPTLVSVDANGLLTAHATTTTQTATITAVANSITQTVTVTVQPATTAPSGATLKSVTISPISTQIAAGTTQQLAATATYSDGTTLDVSSTVLWTSLNAGVVNVSTTGNATAVATGLATLQAQLGSVIGTALIKVTAATLSSLTITPTDANFPAGTTDQFAATGNFSDGTTQNLTQSAVWSTTAPAIAVMGANGLATGVAAGSVQFTASYGGRIGTVTAQVIAPALLSITVNPTSSHLAIGTTEQLAAIATYQDGSRKDITSTVSWTSSSFGVATVSPTGLLTSIGSGVTSVQAQLGSVASTAILVVSSATLSSVAISPSGARLPVGAPQQFTLTGTFSDETTQNLSSASTWSSSATGVATVSGSGLAIGVATGTATITATYNGRSASTPVQVSSATLSSIAITPSSVTLGKGMAQQFKVVGTYSDGTTDDVTALTTFSSSSTSIATVSSAGVAMGMTPGSVQITASFGGKTATTQLFAVTSATLVSMTITPNSPSFARGANQKFTAIGTFSDGTTEDLSSEVTWTSSNPQALTIDQTGLATSDGTGSAQITASLNGISATSGSVTVTAATLTALAVSPTSTQIADHTSQRLIASGTYSDGTTQNLSTDVTWSSSSGTVASIDATGVATGNSAGSATMTASFAGFTASTSSFVVSGATLVSVTFSPANPTVALGTNAQVTVTGTFSDGTTENLTTSAQYFSGNPAAVTVSSTGVLTGVATGGSTITVTVDGVTSTFAATTTNATLASIAITPSSPTAVAKGAAEQFTATGTFSDGSTQNLSSSATWTSLNTVVLTVDNNGLARGAAVGTATLTAAYQGKSATSATVTVNPPSMNAIAVTPTNAVINSGNTQQFTATAVYTDGSTQNVSTTATWTSSNPSLLSVTSSGLATAQATSTTTSVNLTAQLGAYSSTVAVSVEPPVVTLTGIVVEPTSSHAAVGTATQFHAIGSYSDGSQADVSNSVTWSSSNTSDATMSSTGVATAVGPGTVTLQAVSGTFQSQATLVVSSATLASLAISPSGARFALGTVQPFELTGTFSDGTTQDLSASATWISSNSAIATVSGTGVATGVSAGQVQFTGSYGGMSASSGVAAITNATLNSLFIRPTSATFAKDPSQQFNAIGIFSDNTTQDMTSQATFTSSNPLIVKMSATGLGMGLSAGTVEVSAGVGSTSVTSQTVTVTSATLVSIAITPSTPRFAQNTNEQYTAIGAFSDGTTEDLSSQVVWTSSNPEVMTINQSGLASSDGTGSAQITATINGVSATSGQATVTSAQLLSLSLAPASAQVADHTSQQFTLTGSYSDGTTQNLSTDATWSSANGVVASVSANGLATGNSPGSTTLTAAFEGMTASTSSFVVTSATLVSIAFSPASPRIAVGTNTPVTVTGTFSDGTTQNLSASALYSSSNPAAVTVSNTGVITALTPGASTITTIVDGVTSTFTVTVTNATLSSIAITPSSPASFPSGTSVQFTATGTYSDSSTQNLSSTVNWSSSNTAVFTVDSHGLVTGTGAGSGQLSASYQGQTATTASFSVTAAVAASIAVTPANDTISTTSTLQYTATATYTDDSTQNLTSSATWSSSSPTVATIASTGIAVGVLAGITTISAQVSSLSGSTGLTVVNGTVTQPTLQSIAVTPVNASVTSGSTLQYTATASYSDGSTSNVSSSATWSSSSTSVATINSSGLSTSISAGTTTIAAQYGGLSSSTTLTVTSGTVTLQSLAISPSSASIAKGSTQQFTATGGYSDGSTQNLTTHVTWQSSATGVATINTSGVATSVAAGNTQISAAYGGRSATVALTVSPAALVSLAVTPQSVTLANGTTQQYKATGTMTDGGTQDLTTSVTWSSSDTTTATINASGLATADAVGTTTIIAVSGTISATSALTVSSATANSVQLSPSPVTIPAGDTQQLLATASFTDGSSQNVTSSVTYATSNANVATVNTSGLLTAVGPGTATISATLGSASTSITATISSATLTSIAISSPTFSSPVGLSQQLTATGTFSDGSTQNLTNSATWASSAPSVATVSSSGNVTVASAGTTTISATSGTVVGSATFTGTSAVVNAISVSPASATLAAGQTQQFAATATLSDGTQQTVTASAHWSVSNPSDATVSNSAGNNGFFTATAAGTVNVVASINSVSGSASVTIQSATLNSISASPTLVSLPAGTNQPLTITGTYSNGNSANLTASSTFTSSNPSTAAVSSAGVVHGVAGGVALITVTAQTVSTTVPVTVTNATLSSIAITPSNPSLPLGLTDQFTATGTYSDGTTSNITSQVQWSSSAPSVATISSTGLGTPLITGVSTISATLNSITGQTLLTVTSAVLQSITVTAPQTSFALGLSLQLSARGNYSDGSTQNITSTVTWSSQTPSVGVVSSTGLATGVSTGVFNAVATTNGISGSLAITVTSALLQSITVTPADDLNLSLSGGSVQYTATGHFSDGSTQNITNSVLWSLSGVSLGTLSSTGVFSPGAIGAGTITATSGSISGSTNFVVLAI